MYGIAFGPRVNGVDGTVFISLRAPAFSEPSRTGDAAGLARGSRSRSALESAKTRAEWPVDAYSD
jgi:hypothetical protein